MPKFTSQEDVAQWLNTKSESVAQVFAARAALRSLPALTRTFELHGWLTSYEQERVALRTLRCLHFAWVFSAYPVRHTTLARTADYIAAQSIEGAPDVLRSAAYAVGACSENNAKEFATAATNYALEALAFSKRSFEDMLKACSADAEVLDQQTEPATLANAHLWRRPMPAWVKKNWSELMSSFLADGEHWRVWTDWYGMRLGGRAGNQELEVARASIANEVWEQTSTLVNAHIQEILRHLAHGIADERDVTSSHLKSLMHEELSVLGVRVALRAVTLLKLGPSEFETSFLNALLAISSSWVEAKFGMSMGYRAYRQAEASPIGIFSAVVRVSHVPTTLGDDAAFELAENIDSLCRVIVDVIGRAGVEEFTLALHQDLEDLKIIGDGGIIADSPIWSDHVPPNWALRSWDSLKQGMLQADNFRDTSSVLEVDNILGDDKGWAVWIDWYEDRLAGKVRSKTHELAYIEVPDEVRKQGAAAVNTWIRKRIEEAKDPPQQADAAQRPSDESDPSPIIDAPNPLGIVALPDGRITADAGPLATPILPPEITPVDHERSLAACRSRAEQLRAIAVLPTFQGRRDYAEVLSAYLNCLPGMPGTGNILLADGEARILNKMFTAEEAILSTSFAARLTVFLEDHIALRVFYPELERHYVAVKTGRLTRPLKRDAVEAIKQVIHEHTPSVFDNSVGAAMDEVGKAIPHVEAPRPEDTPPPDPNRPKPVKDPITDIDPQKIWSFIFASGANRIWELLKRGKDAAEGLAGWQRAYDQMSPHVGALIEWLKAFFSATGGDGPPTPPTISA